MILALAGLSEIGLEISLWMGYGWMLLPTALLLGAFYFRSRALSYLALAVAIAIAGRIKPLDPWLNPMSAHSPVYDPDKIHWDNMYRLRSACWMLLVLLASSPALLSLLWIVKEKRDAYAARR